MAATLLYTRVNITKGAAQYQKTNALNWLVQELDLCQHLISILGPFPGTILLSSPTILTFNPVFFLLAIMGLYIASSSMYSSVLVDFMMFVTFMYVAES